jgi:NDP-sugar pyrophosphorylase family protein
MVPISGRPLMEYTVALLQRYGISDVFVNLHEKAQTIPAYFAGGENHGVRFHYLVEETLSGTAGPLRNWLDHLGGEPFLVFYGDVLTDIDLNGLIAFHQATRGAATIAVHQVSEPERCGIVTFGEDFRVSSFVEKPTGTQVAPPRAVLSHAGHSNGATPAGSANGEIPAFLRDQPWGNAGVYVLEPEVLSYIPDEGECDFGRDVFPALLRAGRPIYARQLTEYLIDVGSPGRYLQAEQDLQAGRCHAYVAR